MFIVFYVKDSATSGDMEVISKLRADNYVVVQSANDIRPMNCDKVIMSAEFKGVRAAYDRLGTKVDVVAKTKSRKQRISITRPENSAGD